MDRQFLIALVGYLLLQASCVWGLETTALVCEERLYRVEEGESVKVCLRFVGPVELDADDFDDIVVEAGIYTVANGFTTSNVNVSVTFYTRSRGLEPLPCVEVRGVNSKRRSMTVVIVQSSPVEALSNCTVEVVESMVETSSTGLPGITEPMSTRGSPPQPQEAVGPIVGAALGAVIGIIGITFAVVTIVVVYCWYRQGAGSEHKKLDNSNGNPKPVMYKKPGRESSGSEVSISSTATPLNKPASVVIPMDNPGYKETAIGYVSEDGAPSSPIYSNVSHEGSAPLPEEYEVPVPLTTNRSSSVDESPLAYEVPLRSKSDPLYHTLEPPEI